jgi:hypothetical protein
MRLQERDIQIIIFIYILGGVVAARHIIDKFWPGKSLRAFQKRMSKLVEHGYLIRPTKREWRTKPIPEAIYWIGPSGMLLLVSHYRIEIEGDFTIPLNENKQRKLEQQLRHNRIAWIREPKWMQLIHDLAVVDVRLRVEASLAEVDSFSLDEWRNEHDFRSDIDVIEFEVTNRDGTTTTVKKGVCPDSLFIILDQERQRANQPARMRFLLELDGATHSNPRFGRDKVIAGAAYIKSSEYKARFGVNSGRWLVVTTGRRRLENLMRQTYQAIGNRSELFYFTTFEHIHNSNVLVDPIWWQPGQGEPKALL